MVCCGLMRSTCLADICGRVCQLHFSKPSRLSSRRVSEELSRWVVNLATGLISLRLPIRLAPAAAQEVCMLHALGTPGK